MNSTDSHPDRWKPRSNTPSIRAGSCLTGAAPGSSTYDFCRRLEREIAAVLDEAGSAVLVGQIRGRFETADQAATAAGGSDQAGPEARRARAETLR
ncbi:hypothetical protein [Dactylosporangium sp. NPDC005555]|uniref:hypothetical protein n=1 Tax=Dactylosporangium sp. NPDC005555 TaxID=3154889 RepID=UPI0033BE7CAD